MRKNGKEIYPCCPGKLRLDKFRGEEGAIHLRSLDKRAGFMVRIILEEIYPCCPGKLRLDKYRW